MKTTNSKTIEDNKCPEKERELLRRTRRVQLERAGLQLDPTDENKVQVYVDFHKDTCRNLDDPQEVLFAAYGVLLLRSAQRRFANPKGKPAQGMTRVGLVVKTEAMRPEEVLEDAIEAVDYLRKTRRFEDMDYPIGYENVTLCLIHHGFPANGAVPSSVGVGIRLYEL
ncbi:hypothetical protein P170DRAFT_509676 [Aspergillus steynii IBT 23096]|uniref:Uncharacterized protein n=1 Tax=Aspergillus steynii IBT 23096 TaxID=1392250 RepID=A0A2I2G829_9EURO|nr:uncharacterized protein P170DRAFT_509676 [Aspergillus steynii IBT 23096]PLB49024.1 hypothetical protein P170DRAFT_509676 [Aspergillus steynii IBT 23096]